MCEGYITSYDIETGFRVKYYADAEIDDMTPEEINKAMVHGTLALVQLAHPGEWWCLSLLKSLPLTRTITPTHAPHPPLNPNLYSLP